MQGRNKDKLSASDPESPFSEPVILPIEDRLDLHPFSPKDVPSVVEEYIDQCVKLGVQEIRLIHGRGKGVQRRIIRSFLEKHLHVLSFKDAPLEAGGWGATVVALRPQTAKVS